MQEESADERPKGKQDFQRHEDDEREMPRLWHNCL